MPSCIAGSACVNLVLIGSNDEDLELVGGARIKLVLIGRIDDGLAPVEDSRCGYENIFESCINVLVNPADGLM